MEIVEMIQPMKAVVQKKKHQGKSIGLVPTMGFLHEGHLSLIREAVKQSDCAVVSIFVNPAQFGPDEDFERYPRDLENDLEQLRQEGVAYVFFPKPQEMYPQGYKTYVEVEALQDRLCGESRPGHFRGVCTVVMKLFHIIQPDLAFFGQKDAQQAVILKRMVRDMNMRVQLRVMPIIRDRDGLALSSRNVYLDSHRRQAALSLNRSLEQAKKAVRNGERDAGRIASMIRKIIERESLARLEYAAVVDSETLESIEMIQPDRTLIALAVFIGDIRLIDNVLV
jgi:pantoate--beta-alanine ligase